VVVGNHRDGWVYGGVDALSGTAALMEAARATGWIIKTRNWRPRRTIVFSSWGAEEHGLLGSYEWVQVGDCKALFYPSNQKHLTTQGVTPQPNPKYYLIVTENLAS